MDFGSLVHHMVLRPESFNEKYLVLPEKTPQNDLGSKELEAICKELGLKVSGTKAEKIARIREVTELEKQYDEIIAEIPEGITVVPPSQIQSAKAISEKIRGNPRVGPWIEQSEKEKSGFYTEKNGLIVRFQIDSFFEHKNVGVIADLKITRDWHPKSFEYNLHKSGIAIQLAFYRRALRAIEGKDFSAFLIIAVEPKSPHRVRFYQIDNACLDKSDEEIDVLLEEYKERLISNDWSERTREKEIKQVTFKSWEWGLND